MLPVQLQVLVTFHEDSSRQTGFDIQNFWGYSYLLSSEGLCETDNEKKKKKKKNTMIVPFPAFPAIFCNLNIFQYTLFKQRFGFWFQEQNEWKVHFLIIVNYPENLHIIG